MSLVIIDNPFDGLDMCATCLQQQLMWFRNEIKEQWNAANHDGKVGNRVVIPLRLNPLLLMEQAATLVNGNYACVTHMFNDINSMIEMQANVDKAKPRIQPATGSIDGFLKQGI